MRTPAALSALSALSNESRLRAFRLLVKAGHDGMTVGEIRSRLRIPAATLSSHLNVLRQAKLVHDVRDGRNIHVIANFERMDALLGFLTENCCGGQACMPTVKCK